jgi:hypothetical protein
MLRHPVVSRLLQKRARVISDKLELQAEHTIERYRRIAASSTNVLVNPVTGLPALGGVTDGGALDNRGAETVDRHVADRGYMHPAAVGGGAGPLGGR